MTILNIDQIASEIHYKPTSIRTMIAKGRHAELPPMFKRDRRWFANKEAVDAWKIDKFEKTGNW